MGRRRSRQQVEALDRRQLLSAAIAFATPVVVDLGSPGADLVVGRFGGLATVADGVAVRSDGTVTAYELAPDGTLAVVGGVAFNPLDVPQTVVAGDLNDDGLDDLILVGTNSGYPQLEPYLASRVTGGFAGTGYPGDSLELDAYTPSYAGRRAAYLPANASDGSAARVVVFGSTFAGDYGPGTFETAPISTARPVFDFVPAVGDRVLGTEGLQPTYQSPSVVAPATTAVTAGDFDGDGNADVAAVDASTGGVDYQTAPATGSTTIRHLTAGVTDLAAADVNGDGRADLVGWGDPAAPGTVVIWYGTADGTLTVGPTVALPGSVTAVAAADLDGDGHVDLATNVGVVAGRGNGTFAAPVALPDGVSIGTHLLAADVTGDGRPDLVSLSADGSRLEVLANTAGYATAAPTVVRAATSGPAPAGSPIRLTASVTAAAGTPSGTVTFLDGTTPVGTATVAVDGTATLVVTTLTIGPHPITARYAGDAAFAPAVSNVATAHVQRPVTLAYFGPFQGFQLEFTREGVSTGVYCYSVSVLLVNGDGSPLAPPDTSVPRGAIHVTFADAMDASAATPATQSVDRADYDTGSFDIPLNDYGGRYGQYMPGGTYPLTATFAGDDVYAPATLTGIDVAIPSAVGGNTADPPTAPPPVFVRSTTPRPTPSPSPTPTLTTAGSLAGKAFVDANANGFDDLTDVASDGYEAALAGQTVYLDEDGDGQPDADEPSTVTAADGTFAFANLAVGQAYPVRLVVPAGYSPTLPTTGASWALPTAVDPAAAVLIGVAPAGTAPPVPPEPASVTDPFGTNADVPTDAPLPAGILSAGPASADHPASAVTDGDPATFYDATTANGSEVVLDLGPAVPFVTGLTFVPRPGYGTRMIGGVFECSSSPTFASGVTRAYTVGAAPPDGQRSAVYQHVAERYWRYTGPDGGHDDIAEFTLYGNAAEGPTPGLTPAVVHSNVPAAVVAGTAGGGFVRLTLANSASQRARGIHVVHVYAVPTGANAGVLVGTARRRLSLTTGRATAATVRVRLPRTLAAATYTLVATTDDGHTAAGPTVTVTPAAARLSATIGWDGHGGVVAVTVSNAGNVVTAGPITASVVLTNDDGETRTAAARRQALRPGRPPIVLRVRTRVPSGRWVPVVTVSAAGTDPATVTGEPIVVD